MATNIASLVGFAAGAALGEDLNMKEDWPNQVPNRYVILDIDCELTGGKLEFSFRDPGPAQPLAAGLPGAINDALTRAPGPGTTRFVPLDIDAFGDSAYIFLRIVGPNNMTFSATKKAVRHKNADDRDNYGELRHVTVAGSSEEPVPNCRVVYFVADPLSPPNLDYIHGFSLNVEIEQQATIGGVKRLIAFEIDPDIRHPGGTII